MTDKVDAAIDDLEEIAEDYDLDDHDWDSVDDASDYLFEHKVKKMIGQIINPHSVSWLDLLKIGIREYDKYKPTPEAIETATNLIRQIVAQNPDELSMDDRWLYITPNWIKEMENTTVLTAIPIENMEAFNMFRQTNQNNIIPKSDHDFLRKDVTLTFTERQIRRIRNVRSDNVKNQILKIAWEKSWEDTLIAAQEYSSAIEKYIDTFIADIDNLPTIDFSQEHRYEAKFLGYRIDYTEERPTQSGNHPEAPCLYPYYELINVETKEPWEFKEDVFKRHAKCIAPTERNIERLLTTPIQDTTASLALAFIQGGPQAANMLGISIGAEIQNTWRLIKEQLHTELTDKYKVDNLPERADGANLYHKLEGNENIEEILEFISNHFRNNLSDQREWEHTLPVLIYLPPNARIKVFNRIRDMFRQTNTMIINTWEKERPPQLLGEASNRSTTNISNNFNVLAKQVLSKVTENRWINVVLMFSMLLQNQFAIAHMQNYDRQTAQYHSYTMPELVDLMKQPTERS